LSVVLTLRTTGAGWIDPFGLIGEYRKTRSLSPCQKRSISMTEIVMFRAMEAGLLR
jgi:hypothetical protein